MTTKIESRFKAELGDQEVNISPTLIIGLGGSGKKVCERLRRLFFTKFREPGLPVVDYLYIDTDPRDVSGSESTQNDIIRDVIKFNEEDMVDVGTKADKVGQMFKTPNQNRHIFDWFHPSLKKLGTDLCRNGAGQIRPVGRLAFFHHYGKIRKKLEDKLNNITNPAAIAQINQNAGGRYNFQVDGNVCEVFIVGSVAGGTGSGMFLDMAFLVKDINQNLHPTGLFFLPSVFSHIGDEQQDKIRANGYAALMELDYMIAPSIGVSCQEESFPSFDFNWDGEEKSVCGPPFSNVYLLDASNNSGVKLSIPKEDSGKEQCDEAYQMAAEFLFLDYKQSNFATIKRSLRSNLNSHLVNETVFKSMDEDGFTSYLEYFPNRYSSFGLSFIKLNSARKKHAAAYFLGKSLARFWGQSQKCGNSVIDNEVRSALKIVQQNDTHEEKARTFYQKNENKQWDTSTIKDYFLLKQDEGQTDMLEQRLNAIEEDFKELKVKIEKDHKAKIATGADAVFEKMELSHKKLSKEVERVWLKHLGCIDIALGYRAANVEAPLDEKLIGDNADKCHKLIERGLRKHLVDLISYPQTKGVAWAEKFIKAAVEQLTYIANDIRAGKLGKGDCPFELPQFGDDNDVAITKRHLVEAQAIKFSPFRKAATREVNEILWPNQEKEIKARNDALLKAVEDTEKDLLERCKVTYDRFIDLKARNIITLLQESLSKTEVFEKGRVLEFDEVTGFKGGLVLYKNGLENLRAEREKLFEALNRDSEDIKTINVLYRATDDKWYEEKLRTVLKAGASDDWSDILDNQTNAFFDYLKQERGNDRDYNYDYLFKVCRHWEGKGKDWVSLTEALNAFCFKQVTDFMAKESVDEQFQTGLQNGSFSEQQLLEVAKQADAWIPPTLQSGATSVPQAFIGVPNTAESSTAQSVRSKTNVFSEGGAKQHENEEIVFYRELGAFPLFRIGSLADYAKNYFDTTGDDIYKRHIDFTLTPKLRDIMPPADEEKIKAINVVGKLLLEALITRCFEPVKNKDGDGHVLRFAPVAKGASPLPPRRIGQDFLRAAKQYSSSGKDQYRRALEEQVVAQKTRLRSGSGDAVFEMLMVLNEYRVRIYPIEERGSDQGESEAQEGLMQIVVSGLYRDYYAACTDEVSQGGEYTDAQIENMVAERGEQVDLERISMEFPYREAQARQDARVLKMPEERS